MPGEERYDENAGANRSSEGCLAMCTRLLEEDTTQPLKATTAGGVAAAEGDGREGGLTANVVLGDKGPPPTTSCSQEAAVVCIEAEHVGQERELF